MKNELSDYIEKLAVLASKETSLSVSALNSLSRAYVAIHNLVTVKSLDCVFGDQMIYLALLKRLYTLCQRKKSSEKDFSLRCRLVNTMQYLANEPFGPYLPWRDQCYEMTESFLSQELDIHPDCTLPEWLWCIAYWLYPISKDNADSEVFRYLKNCLHSWIQVLSGKDEWPGLPVLDALQRINLLNANSYMFLDNTYDPIIRLLYEHYRPLVSVAPTTRINGLHTMGLLYEQAINFNAYPYDPATKASAVHGLKKSSGLLIPYSDEWLYVISYLIYDLCETLNSADEYIS